MKETESKIGGVTIRTGRNGGKQFVHVTRTEKGMRRVFYDYPPPSKAPPQK